jgi:hypothetical protein
MSHSDIFADDDEEEVSESDEDEEKFTLVSLCLDALQQYAFFFLFLFGRDILRLSISPILVLPHGFLCLFVPANHARRNWKLYEDKVKALPPRMAPLRMRILNTMWIHGVLSFDVSLSQGTPFPPPFFFLEISDLAPAAFRPARGEGAGRTREEERGAEETERDTEERGSGAGSETKPRGHRPHSRRVRLLTSFLILLPFFKFLYCRVTGSQGRHCGGCGAADTRGHLRSIRRRLDRLRSRALQYLSLCSPKVFFLLASLSIYFLGFLLSQYESSSSGAKLGDSGP